MLKRPRLLILSGQSGAGATFVAQGLRDGLLSHAVTPVVVNGSEKRAQLEALVDRASETAGLGPFARELVRALIRFDGLAGALAASESSATAETVIWDAGELDSFLRFLAVLGASRVELAGMIPPIAAMRALQALPPDDVMAWRQLLRSLETARAMLAGDCVRILLIVEPDEGVDDMLTTRLGQLGLMRHGCDAVIVNGVPAQGEGWPEPWAEERRRRVEQIRARGVLAAVVHLDSTDSAGAISFESLAGEVLGIGQAPRPLADRIDERADGGYELHVHLPGVPADGVRAGRIADSLVIEVGGMRRQAPLMPVLSRCVIEGAGMRDDWLIVRFSRNRALWPEAS